MAKTASFQQPPPIETTEPNAIPTPTTGQDPEPTLTPLPTSEATEPSPYPDPGPELPPILEPTVTPTLDAGLELTSTAVLSGTLTLTPTLEAAPAPAQDSPLQLEIDDSLSTPGGSLYLSWQVAESAWKEGSLALLISVPPGFEILSGDGDCTGCSEGEYDPTSGKFVIPLKTPDGGSRFAIPLDLPGPYPVQAELVEAQGDGKSSLALASKDQLVEETGLTRLSVEDAAAGSATAAGLGGDVKLTVPKDAVAEAGGEGVSVRIRQPIPANLPPDSLSGNPFEIVVTTQEQDGAEKTGVEIHEFKEPLLIEIPFGGGRDRSIFTYDPFLLEWIALPTEIDREAGVLRAYTSHLSIFDDDLNEWQMAEMPTLDTAQVSGQTGSSSYSYPIWTPPGPGGLQPSLSLTYNSAMVDGAVASLTQGGWVGMGWSLDVGYIERDFHGTMSAPADDSYNLVLNGVSGTLLKGSDGKYHFQDRNFWKIEYNETTKIWTVWDTAGNKYTFGAIADHRARWPRYGANPCPYTEYLWKWGLSEVENKFGQKLSYSYTKDIKTVTANPCNPNDTKQVDLALYPQYITYPHNRYRIEFKRESRTDYKSGWWSDPSKTTFFQRYRLDKVEIQHDPAGTGSWSAVRTYDLSYSENIFPNYTWSAGGKSFGVSAIQQSGTGSTTRPAVTFTYDGMHLTEVDNGYGGDASFTYETDPWSEDEVGPGYTSYAVSGVNCPYGWQGTGVWCDGDKLRVSGTGTRTLAQSALQQGGSYELYMSVKNRASEVKTLKVSLQYAGSGGRTLLYEGSVGTVGWHELTVGFLLPMNATELTWVVEGSNFEVNKLDTRLLLTRYRVLEKTVDGGITDEGTSQGYEYDGPATNDEAHSQAVADEDNYESKYRSFRGHAASRVIGPTKAGLTRVDTSWYRQDDKLNGRQVGGITMLESYHTAFETGVCGSSWTCAGSQPTITRLEGDNALQLTDPDGGWNTAVLRSSYSLAGTTGAVNTALVQFRASSQPRQMGLGVQKGSFDVNYRRFAVWMDTDGALKTQVYIGTTPTYTTLIPSTSFKADTWYVLLLVVDDQNGFWLSAWPRDHPEDRVEFRYASSSFTGYTWQFIAWANQGTLSLDEYSEGKVYSFSSSGYDIDNAEYTPIDTSEPINGSTNSAYADLQIGWAPITNTVSLSFEGGSLYMGNWSHLEYLKVDQNNSQYGNLTRQEDAYWGWSQGLELITWVKYRATRSQYYPYTSSTKHLVGLPGYQNVYDCPGVSCDYHEGNVISSVHSIYDQNSNFWTAPSEGKLARTKQFVCFADANGNCYEGYHYPYSKLLYSEQALSYDTWGNTVSTTSYIGYGELGVPASSGGRSSLAGYDPTYHTYLVSQTSPLTSTMTTKSYMGYDYALGLPNLQIDPNGGVSMVTYDGLGSPTELRVEGDEGGRASIGAGYFLSWQPMMIDLQQKVVQSEVAQTYNLRKFYDGMGRLIQQQTAKAKLADNACSTDSGVDPDECDIVVDYDYAEDGTWSFVSVPYAAETWQTRGGDTPFITDQELSLGALTELDLLGRAVQVTAPDGTTTQTTYAILMDAGGPYQQTCTTDANSNTTCTRTDSRGRTVEVDPPEGPGVAYTYDAADRLKTATMGGAETELWYDYAGRKTKMDDADMGFWQYGYNALGQLIEQEDARNCITNLNYDLAGRLSSKMYTLGSCGAAATSSVTNTYDGILHWQPFDSWPSTDWVKLGNVSVVNGELKLTGNGSWGTTYAYRTGSLIDGQAVRFNFKTDDANIEANLTLDRGTWGTADYRSWTLRLEGGYLKREYYQGTAYYKTNLLSIKANTWYEGVLTIDGTAATSSSESYYPRFRVVVWERDNPNVWAQNRKSFTADWSFTNWKFVTQVKTNTKSLYLDNVQEYDDGAIGQRSRMNDGSGSAEWVYTSRGQVQSEKKTIGSDVFLTQYGYHPDGSVRWMQYPGGNASQAGEKLEFAYLPQKALESVFSSTNSYFYLQKATYDAAGRVDVRNMGAITQGANPLLKTDLEYFAWNQQGGRLKTFKTGIPTDLTSLQNFEYDYDPVGNIDWIKDFKAGGTQTQSFEYDSLDRLDSAQASGGTGGTYGPFTYAFSATTGNLTGKEGTTLGYNASVSCPAGTRSIPHAASSFGSTTYSYDCNGNQLTRTVPGVGTQTRSFDAENRLVGVSGTATASFIYDGDGQRVKGTVGGVTTFYIGAFFEWTGSTSTMKRYYYAGSIRIAIRVGNGSGTTGLSWLFGDHLGSTSLAVDMNATRTGEHRYRPYGENRFTYLSLPTTFDFTGQRVETSLGLHFFQARYYDSQLGRFISADTIIPKTGGVLAWDRYLFVLGNPLKYTDPSGHDICMDDGDCSKGKIDPIEFLKNTIKSKFGITMGGEKDWSLDNLRKIYNGLMNIDKFLGGKVKSLVDGTQFVFGGDPSSGDYSGLTEDMRITFFVKANLVIPFQNIYHEFGHLLDNAVDDAISDRIEARAHYSNSGVYLFGGGDGVLDPGILFKNYRVTDPDWSGKVQAIQAVGDERTLSTEQWADMFANAVSGNIKMDDPRGRAVYAHVRSYLYPYTGLPQP